jgi:hypothetical protein
MTETALRPLLKWAGGKRQLLPQHFAPFLQRGPSTVRIQTLGQSIEFWAESRGGHACNISHKPTSL